VCVTFQISTACIKFVKRFYINLSFQTKLSEDKAFIAFITSRKVLVWSLSLGGLHLAFMGYSGWHATETWPAGLPLVSLIAFSFFSAGYALNIFGRE